MGLGFHRCPNITLLCILHNKSENNLVLELISKCSSTCTSFMLDLKLSVVTYFIFLEVESIVKIMMMIIIIDIVELTFNVTISICCNTIAKGKETS